MHYCAYHKLEEPESRFRVKKNGKLDSWCIEGRKEHGRAYSKNAYATRKAQVAEEKAAREARETQVCTECGVEKDIEQFPWRYDRPDKRQAKCEPCLGAWKRERNRASYERTDGALKASAKRALIAKCTIGNKDDNREYSTILRKDPCSYCGRHHENMQIDHIDPIYPAGDKHGDHDWTNFTAACPFDNNSKNEKPLLQYLLDR